MDSIYNEMYNRNTSWLLTNSVIADPLLLTPDLDDRKCIALVAKDPVQLLDLHDIESISLPLSNNWMMPRIHSTFIVLRGWDTKLFIKEDWTKLKEIILTNIQPYEIVFDRVIPVKTGLVLCGSPSIDVNMIRDKIRAAGYETDVLYKCDIAHTTLLRWTDNLDNSKQLDWLRKIMDLPRKPYAKIKITGFNIILASWSMHPDTIEILESIPLSKPEVLE